MTILEYELHHLDICIGYCSEAWGSWTHQDEFSIICVLMLCSGERWAVFVISRLLISHGCALCDCHCGGVRRGVCTVKVKVFIQALRIWGMTTDEFEFCVVYWHLVSATICYSFLCMQITRSDIRSRVKQAVHCTWPLNLPQGFAWVCMGKYTL